MLTGTNLVHTRQYNLRIVLEVIRQFGPLSRADVARRTELTVQTVSNLVKELVRFGLIADEAEQRREGPGAPSRPLAIKPEAAWTIGLDLDRDHLTGVLVDLGGSVRQRIHHDIDFPAPPEALDLLSEVANALIEKQSLARNQIAGVGVGIPGPMHRANNPSGYVANPKQFPGWERVPLAEWLEERLGLPVLIENNATAAAIGERWYGAGQQIRTFFYVYFGSGLGGGLILDGQPYEGFTGNAGELGYLPAHLSAESSSPDDAPHVGIHFRVSRLYEMLRAGGEVARTPSDLERLYRQHHAGLLAWLDEAANQLTGVMLAIEYLFDPEAIFFGGRLPEVVLSGLLERLSAGMPVRPLGSTGPRPHYRVAAGGVDAAALGVATLPIYDLFAPAPHLLLKPTKQPPGGLNRARVSRSA
jgi:predicted NBD/HSP70 family sugar kinase